jgi:hypothetical protein
MPLAQETNRLSCVTTLVPVARIGVPLLLKTILLHPIAAAGAPTGRIFFSIAAREFGSNEGGYQGVTCVTTIAIALKSCISIIGVWDIRFIETSQTDL